MGHSACLGPLNHYKSLVIHIPQTDLPKLRIISVTRKQCGSEKKEPQLKFRTTYSTIIRHPRSYVVFSFWVSYESRLFLKVE